MSLSDHDLQVIALSLKLPIEPLQLNTVSGGDISEAFCLRGADQQFFLKKSDSPNALSLYESEKLGLEALAAQGALIVPRGHAVIKLDHAVVFAMAWLELVGPANWSALGRGLAEMHKLTHTCFGWHADNFIGLTRQRNTFEQRWAHFFWHYRLMPQLELAYQNGYTKPLACYEARLCQTTQQMLSDHSIAPSLVHGDLWSGNVGFCQKGQPAIYDPAVYYGDREVDLALSRLFGGFPPTFYQAYEAAWPLPKGHLRREVLYNLYHLLNHLNLFGGSYLNSCLGSIERLIKH